jgi:hypothetical protein
MVGWLTLKPKHISKMIFKRGKEGEKVKRERLTSEKEEEK